MASLAIPLVTAGLSGLAGLFGSRPTSTTASGTQDNNTSTNYNYTRDQQLMMQNIMNQYQNQINGTDLSGYQSQGLQNINQTGNAQTQAINNMLAQRGLLNSPAAATSLTQQRIGQAGQQSQFLNSIPLLKYQLQSQALTGAGNFLNGQRVNTTGTSHTSSQETQKGSGNMLGGLFAGVGSGIAGTLGKQFANQGKT